MDAPVEVAVTGQHRGGVQIAVDDFLLDRWVQRTTHAVAGGTGKPDDTEAELFQLRQQAGRLEVQLHRPRPWRQGRLDPGLAYQAQLIGFFRQQPGSDHVARVAGVGAAGNGSDDHRAIGHLPGHLIPRTSNATLGKRRRRQALVRIGRAGHVAHHAGQIEAQHALVLDAGQVVSPQAGGLGVDFHQANLLVVTAGQLQVLDGLPVDGEHRGGSAELRGHVGNGRAVTQGQRRRAFAVELKVGANHLGLTQVLGERQHHIGGGDPRLWPTGQLNADDIRQAHPRCPPEHHALRFQATYTDGDHPQRVDMRRVAVGAHASIGKG